MREGSLFVLNAEPKRIWLRESLILQDPTAIIKNMKEKDTMYYFLPEDFIVEEYLERVGRDNYFVVNDLREVPTNRFGEDPRTFWAFQDQATEYGKLLEDKLREDHIHIYMLNSESFFYFHPAPFANQLFLDDTTERCYGGINGQFNYLSYEYKSRELRPHLVRGVLPIEEKALQGMSIINTLKAIGY